MINRENLIKGLKCCLNISEGCTNCPYNNGSDCGERLVSDTVELLNADQLELIRQRERIETLERIVDHMEQSINDIRQYLKILAMRR